ncbi:MAG: hypothetical protein GEV11_03660 [Streptosporangiales bacterium]|nr:hypothetical protein [Streptosporangiales bacterium]
MKEAVVRLERFEREEDGAWFAALAWRAGPGWRVVASSLVGGGLGERSWVLNAQVSGGYARLDPDEHLREIAAGAGLEGPGVAMMTAASVDRVRVRTDGGVAAAVTVGLGRPTWAAASPELDELRLGLPERYVPGTINIVVAVPAALSDAALVNAAATATEAKVQGLLDAGLACTGTASDAICVAARTGGVPDPFGGPRSRWGAPLARAVHAAVKAGALSDEWRTAR